MFAAMDGVTTAIVAFILACVIFPHVVKNKPQYYGALGAVLLIILFSALGHLVGNAGFWRFVFVITALLQMGAILLLILSAGGLTVKDLAGELADTIEVVRRGGDKEIIVPLRGETPRRREGRTDEDARQRIDLDAELGMAPGAPPPGPSAPKPDDESNRGIPLA
jgi:hypothetical protein